jgi:hypothetical protein
MIRTRGSNGIECHNIPCDLFPTCSDEISYLVVVRISNIHLAPGRIVEHSQGMLQPGLCSLPVHITKLQERIRITYEAAPKTASLNASHRTEPHRASETHVLNASEDSGTTPFYPSLLTPQPKSTARGISARTSFGQIARIQDSLYHIAAHRARFLTRGLYNRFNVITSKFACHESLRPELS